ncbi:MAG: class I SAM-dependent methyltransferase [Schwartzia sp.]|nr:class I SAM-dependent methyltransferase [Schwartzia sp. (in: firmicutes)]
MAELHTSFSGPLKKVPQIDQFIDKYITQGKGNYDGALIEEDSWEVFYHLSDMRTGLLGWYDFPKNAAVLELGCGFGALTGMLCDKAAHVTVVEHSMFRAHTTVKRWQDRDNLDVYVGSMLDMPFKRKFDVIIMVDVFSMLGKGSRAHAPYVEYMKYLQDFLSPHGRVLIAVDNRLGLKYFCGARDPYSGEPFGELGGGRGKGCLFSRKELDEILGESGFSHRKFYYPLPDFRLPQFIFTDEHLPKSGISEEFVPYDPAADTRVLSELRLYPEIIDNGMFAVMSNSFLVECAMQEDFSPVLSAKLATDRMPAYNIATCFMKDGSVIKRPLTAAADKGIRELDENMRNLRERGLETVKFELCGGDFIMEHMELPTLSEWLAECTPKDKDEVMKVFDRLWAAILQASPPTRDEDNFLLHEYPAADWGVILKRAYINMVPENIFVDRNRLIFFNQGLTRENCPAKYQMFLAIYESTSLLERIMPIKEAAERFGIDSLWDIMAVEEQNFVSERRRYDAYHMFYEWADMDPVELMKNRQLLKIMNSDV